MPRLSKPVPPADLRRCCILSCLGALALGAGQASAWSPDQLERLPSVILAQATGAGGQARPEQQAQGNEQAASSGLDDLNEVLAATQAKLQELFEATAALAEGREAFEAMKQENGAWPPPCRRRTPPGPISSARANVPRRALPSSPKPSTRRFGTRGAATSS